jgi:hypothetical protein
MALVLCEVSNGLRAAEATAIVEDFGGRREFIPVDRDFLSEVKGKWYLPIVLLRIDEENEAALVQLPSEADSGANRLWVKRKDILQPRGVPA